MRRLKRWLVPLVELRDLPAMLSMSAAGAVIAGTYGALHDQITYSISPEYFTKLKFNQFDYADLGYSDRCFVAVIGFLATWWVGFVCAWFLARRLVPGQPKSRAWQQLMFGFAWVFVIALTSAGFGWGYGWWRGPEADYSAWQPLIDELGIADSRAFVRVAYIHNASYLGGLAGLIVALTIVRPQRQVGGGGQPCNPKAAAGSE